MSGTYTRRINLYINGKEVSNDIKSVSSSMSKLRNEQRQMTIGSKEYIEAGKKIRYLRGIMQQHNASLRQTTSLWQKSLGKLKSLLPAFGVGAIAVGLSQFISKMNQATEASDGFEERLDNLSALTGLEGEALEKLGDIAKQTSVKITDGGVVIKQSADDIVDAYTKVGSQRPELLKNGEALAQVTEDAIILSEAAKSELEPAVAGLTTTMNQFNLPASESRRIINAMSAGSKEGAADIPYLTEAVEKSGTTMNLMNISLEENIGLIETIAPKYAKASLAGNSLDKVFLKLKEKQIGYASGTFKVNDALDELEKRYNNGETAASIFGVEHAKMGELLVQNREQFNYYTKAVTGTNTAIEQAVKNTNNAKAIQAQARNEFHLSAIELGEKLSPAMVTLYRTAGSVAAAFTKLIATSPVKRLQEEQKHVSALVVELSDANTAETRRKTILDELEKINPKIVSGLDSENLSVVKLKNNMKLYNEEIVNRMVLANLSLEEEKYAADAATAKTKLMNEQYELMTLIAKVNPDIAFGAGTLEEKAKKIQATLKETANVTFYGDDAVSEDKINLVGIGNKLQNIVDYQNQLNTAQTKQIDFSGRVQAMKDMLGITQDLGDAGTPEIGDKKTVGNFVYQWDGETWKVIQDLTTNPSATNNKDPFATEEDDMLGIDNWMVNSDKWDKYGAEELAAKKASEEEWTDFLNGEIQKRVDAQAAALGIEEEIAQARIDLKDMQIEAIGQLASTMAGMFEQGSAAQIAMVAIEKAIAIAQIWMNLAREKSAINLAAAQMSTIPLVGPGMAAAYKATMTAKAIAGAKINTGLIAAQAIATGVSMGNREKTNKYAGGGFTKGETLFIAGEEGTEWIAPNWMLQNPATSQILSALENLRANPGNINAMLSQMAEGGLTGKSSSSSFTVSENTASNSEVQQLLQANLTLMKYLAKTGIKYSMQEFKETEKTYNDITVKMDM